MKSARIFKNRISPSNDANTPSSTSKTLGGMNNSSTTIIREKSEKSTQNVKKVEKTSTSRKSINVDLDEKTTARVQTIVSDKKRSVQEVWDDTLESIKAGRVA